MHCRRGRLVRQWLLGWLWLAFLGSALAASTPLSPEDVVSIKTVGDVALSPDGKWVAYVLHVPRSAEDPPGGRYNEIWLVGTDGSANRRLTAEKASAWAPAWSPDGRRISFLGRRGEAKHTQVYALPLDGGEARQLTHAANHIRSYRWSPDGRWIAYLAADPESRQEKEAREKGHNWEVFEQNYKHTRLWLLDVATGEEKQLPVGEMSVWQLRWSPDSRFIVFTASDKPFTDDSYMFKKLYRIGLDGASPQMLVNPQAKIGAFAVSPDGSKLAYLAGQNIHDPSSGTIFILDLTSRQITNLSANFQATHTWLDWWDNQNVVASAIQGVQTQFFRWNLKKGTAQPLTRMRAGDPVWFAVDLNRRARLLAVNGSTPQFPPEVFVVDGKGKARRLTDSNPWLKDKLLGKQEVIEWPARDGLRIQGILIKPVGFQPRGRYPLVVQVHGGPESAYLNGWNTYYIRWSQLLAGRGYMVLAPNYRGSIGRGVAFAGSDHQDLGGAEFNDVLDGIRYLVREKGWVDSTRVGIGGGSYGGYFSAWAATRHSQHFAASVVFAGISNWISFTGTTDIPNENSLVHWAIYWTDSQANQTLYWDRSPLAHIRNAGTPTLIAHGKRDLRVPPGQSHELYRALQFRKVPTELVLYPREPHGLRERAHQLDFIQRVLEWYDKYLKGIHPAGDESGANP